MLSLSTFAVLALSGISLVQGSPEKSQEVVLHKLRTIELD